MSAAHADPVAEATVSLRDGLRRFVARRVPPADVDDLVQDVFLRMTERAGELRDEERLAGWAFRIAQSVVADHHRSRRDARPLDEADEPSVDPRPAADENVLVASWLRPMLFLLPDVYADALERVDLGGESLRDYAARTGLSLSGAKTRVQRARRMLEGVVRACCDLEQDVRGNVLAHAPRGPSCACAPKA